ncbi:MAG: hypothetical protein LBR92_03025 [Puniceicoccales bacterium]|jgi:hypothetical protein|nr:hypothetical protein [Puniceicoccales bacterium]
MYLQVADNDEYGFRLGITENILYKIKKEKQYATRVGGVGCWVTDGAIKK